ncbi:(d)CMP kinase [Thermobrachium celere]|uniref:Cytidylate kinase n=1 Tax=Thermobrachium celere DSM 8682 TaxID=941824 RepID=R7RSD7_9CLOT|nr:(d)CMP kinase [Thermobrachium celere]GFR34313.1 cytidylate kinase [Thermobrachium celere]CDF58165.1 Cytidylate kinase [Thermobrachium celere DSM 8682]
MNRIAIAIDGPAGAGKSTISRLIAEKMGIEYIDTGAMYRAITLKLINKGVDISDIQKVKDIVNSTKVELVNGRVYLDEIDVTEEIRMPYVSAKVSDVAAIPCVRERLVHLQREMAKKTSVIMDGRDIGTNVLKDAEVKIYLTASVEERAKRRYIELKNKGIDVTFEEICNDIKNRDNIDTNREVNPLRKADDAVLVDTTGKSIQQVVDEIISIIKEGANL